ncbi:uncharacterized protein BX663DRAFT_511505 [Cokeromyces recurvatus]|uniref:uncharacterized protein n=1 Tax=Cokeromyces recurvatus TaxID=90255 RepID=UPI002220131F|nr:uncharacterized protein BX663DRAFT_511505 [Cokeromyces recurvatus]KAI7902032.1 hypothetical protein BX663DRAFT_511505 [Cokeromyces recurvatus]
MEQQITIPIIYWTTWFNTNQWEGYTIDNCNLNYTCKITHDRTKLVDSSVVIFHASDMDDTMPSQTKNRAWVYHNAEAPKYQPTIINQMQYSMTYRLDSDFPWGYFEKRSLLEVMETTLNKTRKMKVPIAWIVSNCKASNYRHHYVRELNKWIDIDIYGHCMNNIEFPENTSTIELISRYHFYLALENSNCKDYVTEKLSHAYMAGVIPIVDGPSNYGPFIPNTHSVIRLDDFKSPKELALYLNQVLSQKDLYDSYLDYRKPGGVSNEFKETLNIYEQGQCRLCQLAHDRYMKLPYSYYPGKKIYLDNTCERRKHFNFKQTDIWKFYLPFFIFILLPVLLVVKKKSRFTRKKK